MDLRTFLNVHEYRIQLVLKKDKYKQDDVVTGDIHIKNGKKNTKVENVSLYFSAEFFNESHEKVTQQLYDHIIEDNFYLYPNEKKKIPLQHRLDFNIPITTAYLIVKIKCKMTILKYLPVEDTAVITILPSFETESILYVMRSFGFEASYRSGSYQQGYQIFEFRTNEELLSYGLDNLLFSVHADAIYIYMKGYIYCSKLNKYQSFNITIPRHLFATIDDQLNLSYLQKTIYDTILFEFSKIT